ncbi:MULTISPECIES: class I SAM-dependent methyltransferase [unclassified Carboxydocella]|uniref:class I SAM-dependent methyltransferase n=1 Tax=unclassified Carboxydocella TaxID=2685367 RepID=UPI0009AD7730|nr:MULTISPECIES: class I SAM-dependent methyltransferase [unclassified Carboxydocella]AVX30466.1 Putative rRNA methylase [Carboxydocella thermautotrophica]GAW27875.1 rRNA methyltransferase [Carboxydocella sp. ULO1]GAW31634.1 rRNA methyltransferase [Carboxydocella sp. JDF658]
MSSPLAGAVALSHFWLAQVVRPGDRAVDATCGNGHDTQYLAELVGENGKVWAFDVQETAISNTKERLEAAGLAARVELIPDGHQHLKRYVSEPVKAVVFNLGYLPGSDKRVITLAETTLNALQQAVELLLPGGIIAIAIYTGHAGGEEEAREVESWAAALPRCYNVWSQRLLNRSQTAPYLLLVEKGG